jgi:hypothetical protein
MYFKIFIYLFIPQFLAEPLTMFCGTLVGKPWSGLKFSVHIYLNWFLVKVTVADRHCIRTEIDHHSKSDRLYVIIIKLYGP